MNLINATKLLTGCTGATDKTGREHLVVVAKGTYGIPFEPGVDVALLDDQVALFMTDVFTGEPGVSAPLHELDFAPCKPRCDVLISGSCHAPGGVPAARVPVGMRVGALTKSFNVVGPRVYERGPLALGPGVPGRFTVMPISYDNAYGGIDRSSEDPARHRWYLSNHVGVGYHPDQAAHKVDGRPLPNTEEMDCPVEKPDGPYRPMAFGPLGRGWQQRVKWAGTYDKAWLDDQFPFLPQDFDTRYFQCAPEDQQMDPPQGGEEVVLMHLTPEGRTQFRLPADLKLPVLFFDRTGSVSEVLSVVDTVCIEPDERRFTLTWRASLALRRNIRELSQVMVGVSAHQLERQRLRDERMRGKRKFTSLGSLVAWSRAYRQPREPADTRQ